MGLACASRRMRGQAGCTTAWIAFRVASRSFALANGKQLGPSQSAMSGCGWNSRKTPSAPAATAALAMTATPSRRPPVVAPPVAGLPPAVLYAVVVSISWHDTGKDREFVLRSERMGLGNAR